MGAIRLGVVTDTHVGDELRRLPRAVVIALSGVDTILHAGDACTQEALRDLAAAAPLVAVRGNHDRGAAADLPGAVVVECAGARIGMVHGERHGAVERLSALRFLLTGRIDLEGHCRALARMLPPVDLVVFGHLHLAVDRRVDGTRFFSPGSVYQPELDPGFSWRGARRRVYRRLRRRLHPEHRRPAIGLLTIESGRIDVERIILPSASNARE